MNINALIHTLQTVMPQIAESYCIVNGAVLDLNEVQNMGYDEFSERAKKNMPLKLYKYFPNHTIEIKDNSVNYSIQALKNNTIFIQRVQGTQNIIHGLAPEYLNNFNISNNVFYRE